MSTLPTRKFLDLSTSHLQQATCNELGGLEGVVAYSTPYGWLMYATENADEYAAEYDWPEELLPIMKLARANGCAYILFDRDADMIDELPSWEW